jgi:hypothetical protein
MAVVAAWQPVRDSGAAAQGAPHGRNRTTGPRQATAGGRRLAQAAIAIALLLGIGGGGWYFAGDLVSAVAGLPDTPDPKTPDLKSSDLNSSDFKAPDLKVPDLNSSTARLPDKSPATMGPLSPQERPSDDPRQRINDFVNSYNGGDCFFITAEAVADGKANIDGMGRSVAPFEVLDYEFKRHNGFEASIGVHEVMTEQCPAIGFLYQTRNQRATAPRLEVATAGLKDGVVKGSITDSADRNVELVLVGDDGYVRNVTSLLKVDGAIRTFAMGLTRANPGPPRPQLLIAIGSSKPLAALKLPADGALAEQVFSQVLAEASQTGQMPGVSAKYFMLEK